MKNLLWILLPVAVLLFTQCDGDDPMPPQEEQGPFYNIQILSPDTQAKHVGDTIQIEVLFSELAGETIHHINLRIYEKADTAHVVYHQPDEAHVHQPGTYTFTDEFILNVPEHTDWILEAKAWGEEAGVGEVTESIEFHVHP